MYKLLFFFDFTIICIKSPMPIVFLPDTFCRDLHKKELKQTSKTECHESSLSDCETSVTCTCDKEDIPNRFTR